MAAGVGGGSNTLGLWKRLGNYGDEYLRAWKSSLADPDPAPRDVLDAFNELAYAVTGPRGFWRDTVPNKWLGCASDAGAPACKTLTANDWASWDKLQEEIGNVPSGQEAAFIAKNGKRMMAYLDTYVPEAPSMSGMKQTAFFKAELAEKMGATASDDDL